VAEKLAVGDEATGLARVPGALISGIRRTVGGAAVAVRRRTALRRRRLGACVALTGAAIALRGSVGVLLAILALMLILDSLIPMPGATWSEADDRFSRLVRERSRARRRRRLRRLAPEGLDVLDERGWVSTAERRALGVQAIPIDSITGTVEESKARIFDRSFRPGQSACERWTQLWMAQARGATISPISVYRVDAEHIVRDGHHRVSVARDQGWSTIDAEVVELLRPHRGR
jgi:hypothetical protein